MCRPELLILDEPTNGLDPAGMKRIRTLLKNMSLERGITILVSSHILSEIESVADTVGVICRGELTKEIAIREIEEMSLSYIELSVLDVRKAAYLLTENCGITNFKILEDKIRIYDPGASTKELTKALALGDVDVTSIGKKAETLEDYFLKLTGEAKGHVEIN